MKNLPLCDWICICSNIGDKHLFFTFLIKWNKSVNTNYSYLIVWLLIIYSQLNSNTFLAIVLAMGNNLSLKSIVFLQPIIWQIKSSLLDSSSFQKQMISLKKTKQKKHFWLVYFDCFDMQVFSPGLDSQWQSSMTKICFVIMFASYRFKSAAVDSEMKRDLFLIFFTHISLQEACVWN